VHTLTVHTLGRTLIADPTLWVETGQFWEARERLWRWINQVAGERRSPAEAIDTTAESEVAAAILTVQSAVEQVIEQRHDQPRPDDLLADLLHANTEAADPLGPAEIRDQVIALLFAAHETSAVALFWSLYLLSGHPQVRDRVEREVDDVLAGRLPEAADLALLPYTLQVIREAMRLYPPAARQFRVTTRDTILDGYPIAADTPVSVCQYLLHRDATAFPDPDTFGPDRFALRAPARHPLAYLPFGAGSRTCIGRHYALQEAHLVLAVLVSRYRFEFDGPVRPRLAVTLRPADGVKVRVRRHRASRAYSGRALPGPGMLVQQ
jgi:cytochrome P450